MALNVPGLLHPRAHRKDPPHPPEKERSGVRCTWPVVRLQTGFSKQGCAGRSWSCSFTLCLPRDQQGPSHSRGQVR